MEIIDSFNATPFAISLCTMGLALRRLLDTPSVLNFLKELVATQDGILRVTACCQCHLSPNPRRRLATTTLSPLSIERTEGRLPSCESPIGETQTSLSGAPTALIRKVEVSRALIRKTGAPKTVDFQKKLTTWEELWFQSDVNDDNPATSVRLVDYPEHRANFHLWIALLEFRQRVDGSQGIASIWRGIIGRRIHLPVDGPQAETLWRAFTALGLEDPPVLWQVYRYANKLYAQTGTRWPGLYKTVVGHFLPSDPKKGWKWHRLLEKPHRPRPDDLDFIFNQALQSEMALRVFRRIYLELDVRTLYDSIITRLCDLGLYSTAQKWHKTLMKMQDLPSSSTVVEPLIQHLSLDGQSIDVNRVIRSLIDAAVPLTVSTSKALRDNRVISREIMSLMLGRTHLIAPKHFKDEFWARLFATKALSVSTVLNGLRVLGFETIGPLSMREIGLRDATPRAVALRMDLLENLGISIGKSVFSILVRKFALEDKAKMLSDLLSSDKHPDVFEDFVLQQSLLASYLKTQNRPQYDITMAALTAYAEGHGAVRTWNLVLQSHLRERNFQAAAKTLEDMRIERVLVTTRSCRLMRSQILRYRKRGKRPVSHPGHYDDLELLINLWQGILRSGRPVRPIAWREVLRRLGQTNRLDEVEKLALWLTAWYSPQGSENARARLSPFLSFARRGHNDPVPEDLPPPHPRHPYSIIFSTLQQEAIVAWGFRNIGVNAPKKEHREWTWGLRLLSKLRNRGVVVHISTVRRVLQQRLTILYGPGRSAVRANRLARAKNPFSLEAVLAQTSAIWGPSIQEMSQESLLVGRRGRRVRLTRMARSKRRLRLNSAVQSSVLHDW